MSLAARELGIDKATVSRRLAALERQVPGLFERRASKIVASAAATRAIEAASNVERAVAQLQEILRSEHDTRGSVRLTLPGPIAGHVVIPAISSFKAAHPEIDLVLLATTRVLDLARDEADVAVRNVVPQGSGIVSRRVARIATALYASRDYLKRRGTPIAHSLAGHDFLDFAHSTYAQAPLDWLPQAVREANVVLRADDPMLLIQAAAAGLGIAALPAVLAEDEPKLVRIGSDVSVAAVYIVVRAEVRRLARIRIVASWVGELMAARLAWLSHGS
jgi:DNA-binding transcriptional LysR family regulator